MEIKFIHHISKGSKFNQIYIPKEAESNFEVGDLVEIKLIKKKQNLFYSLNLEKLSSFKEKLIKELFSFFSKYKEIKQVFIFGSFLTKNIEYHDIDILILTDRETKNLEKNLNDNLIEEFNLKFHITIGKEDRIKETLKICPVTRSMLYYYASNKKFDLPKETAINESHLKYLLMMPEDLLKIKLPFGKVYYSSLRKLIVIERFLKKNEIAPDEIDSELLKLIKKMELDVLKENLPIEGVLLKDVKSVIRKKLNIINDLIKNGKK